MTAPQLRPLYRPEVVWITDRNKAVPPLDAVALESIRARAEGVTRQCAEWLSNGPPADPAEVSDREMAGAYAAGVAETLHWLLGADPAPYLAEFFSDEILGE